MHAVIGLLLTLAVVSHGLPTTLITNTTYSTPSYEGTSSSTLAPPSEATTTASPIHTTASAGRRSQVDQVIVLPHEIHSDPSHPESLALLKVVSALQQKDPVLKGVLVDHDIGNKFFLIKPKSAGKAIRLKSLRGQFENSTLGNGGKNPFEMGVKKPIEKEVKKTANSKDVGHSRQKRFSLRNIALPLTIFHYLGFLPMRVPGLPYHVDPGLPDYTEYEPYNDLAYPNPPIRSRSSRYRQY